MSLIRFERIAEGAAELAAMTADELAVTKASAFGDQVKARLGSAITAFSFCPGTSPLLDPLISGRGDADLRQVLIRNLVGRAGEVEAAIGRAFPEDRPYSLEEVAKAAIDDDSYAQPVRDVVLPFVYPPFRPASQIVGGHFTFQGGGRGELVFDDRLTEDGVPPYPIYLTFLKVPKRHSPPGRAILRAPKDWRGTKELYERLARETGARTPGREIRYGTREAPGMIALSPDDRRIIARHQLTDDVATHEMRVSTHYHPQRGAREQRGAIVSQLLGASFAYVIRWRQTDYLAPEEPLIARNGDAFALDPWVPQFFYLLGGVWEVYGHDGRVEQFLSLPIAEIATIAWADFFGVSVNPSGAFAIERLTKRKETADMRILLKGEAKPRRYKISVRQVNKAGLPLLFRLEGQDTPHLMVDSLAVNSATAPDVSQYLLGMSQAALSLSEGWRQKGTHRKP